MLKKSKISSKKLNKLIICDLDGTLVDSLVDITTAANAVRSHFDCSLVSAEQVRDWIGDGVTMLVKRLMADTGISADGALDVFRSAYEQHMLDTTAPFKGIIAGLDELDNHGYQAGILSNKGVQACRAVLAGLPELNRRMVFVYGGDSFSARKPSPVPVQQILGETGFSTEDAVMVGDSPNDLLAGRGAGVQTAAVLYGYTDPESLRECEPDTVIAHPGEFAVRLYSLFQEVRSR